MVKPIKDTGEIRKALRCARELTFNDPMLALDFVSKKNWVTVPFESAMHFDKEYATNLAEAANSIGCRECYAIASEPLKNFPKAFKVRMTKRGLLNFSHECGSFFFLLLPKDQSFVVFCTPDNYFVVAGTIRFVEQFAGADINTARSKFDEFASDESWGESERKLL